MSTTSPISSVVTDVTPAQPAPGPSAGAGGAQAPAAPVDTSSDLRLVIEDDKAAGSYVYKTIDPRTGKVISQIPREELLRMRETPDYTPGSVFNARS
jgi:flagellar protein FlaG